MEVVKGQVVISRRGRDVGCVYVAIGQSGQGANTRLLLCDGEKRTLQNPKAKNRLHLQPTGTILPDEDITTDLKLKKALCPIKKQMAPKPKGG